MLQAWTEFKNTVLPLIIAVAVVWLVTYEKHRSEDIFAEQTQQITTAISSMQELLQEQGYRVPPTIGTR